MRLIIHTKQYELIEAPHSLVGWKRGTNFIYLFRWGLGVGLSQLFVDSILPWFSIHREKRGSAKWAVIKIGSFSG